MSKNLLFKVLFITTLLLINPTSVFAVNVHGPAPHFIAEENIDITNEVYGDTFLVGSNIRITRPVNGDLFLIGENVLIDAPVSGDVRVIGSRVNIRSYISGSLGFISEKIYISNAGEIDNDAYGVAQEFSLSGKIGGNLNILQNDNAEAIIAGRILGNIHYSGSRPTVSEEANVTGEIKETNLNMYETSESDRRLGIIMSKIFHSLSLILIAYIIWRFFQKKFVSLFETYKSRFSETMLFGVAAVLLIPLVVLLLLVSVIGIPIALISSAIIAFLIYISPILPATFIGSKIFQKDKVRFLHIVCGIFIFDVVSLGTVIGSVLYFISIVSVLGLVLKLLPRYRSKPLSKS